MESPRHFRFPGGFPAMLCLSAPRLTPWYLHTELSQRDWSCWCFFYLWENALKMISELLQGLIREVLVCIGYKGKTALTRNQTENNKTGSFHSQLLEGLSNLSKAFLFLSRHWFYKMSLWRDNLHLHFPLLPFTLAWKPLQSLITRLQQNKQNLWTCLTPECH